VGAALGGEGSGVDAGMGEGAAEAPTSHSGRPVVAGRAEGMGRAEGVDVGRGSTAFDSRQSGFAGSSSRGCPLNLRTSVPLLHMRLSISCSVCAASIPMQNDAYEGNLVCSLTIVRGSMPLCLR